MTPPNRTDHFMAASYLAEAPDRAEAQHIAFQVADAGELVVALPFAAYAEVRRDVELQARAVGQAVAGFAAAVLHFAVMAAELAVDAELVVDREEADAEELPGIHLGAAVFAEIGVAQFSREVAVHLIAAEKTPGGVLVIASAADVLQLRLSDARADIEAGAGGLRSRRKPERRCRNAKHCNRCFHVALQ